ncbi:hypothetical protein [Streptomyces genisteinicus]|uniref:DUF1080 domain-containing protein n=1 Tax=Streptomyces genisteinicus TaxID=2768068 RepID=A0A7H0I2K7_9ACTN|nr:hypothetical protein [Streptomyces genisteinicus]QNP67023.1 hypothetical protein IAG43_31730 [Streptomyces genisteinicus]
MNTRRNHGPLARRALLAAAVAASAGGTAAAAHGTAGPAAGVPDPPGTTPAPEPAPAPVPATEPTTPDPAGGARGPGQGTGEPPFAADPVCFRARFPDDGLVTNEYAFRRPDDPHARTHPDWDVTSGSLFARWTYGWTGVPDDRSPDAGSAGGTGSCVFRLVTRRRDLEDVAVTFRALVEPPVATPGTRERDWDGAHLWLRYRSPQELYALSFRRRDGIVVLKRKSPGEPGGEGVYRTLAQTRHPVPYGRWHRVSAQARSVRGGVLLRLAVNGRLVLRTVDTTPGALRGPGGVGLRGDNTSLVFDRFTVREPRLPGLGHD